MNKKIKMAGGHLCTSSHLSFFIHWAPALHEDAAERNPNGTACSVLRQPSKLVKRGKFKSLVFCNGAWCDTINNIEMRRRDTMPELSRFGGMVIYMLFMDT